jgi:chemosensory pili system protein ChpA (sensor histidine kinase/response regulator)
MTADPTQDLSGLRWIRGELDENLRRARLLLEDFADETREEMDEAVSALHEVQGALSLAGVYGAAMLADELERVADALNRGEVKRPGATAEVLMLGIAQVPAYLERVERGEPDIPLVLLPLMNDLRASRDAPLVSETSLFAPKLDAQLAADPVLPGSGNPELSGLVTEQRLQFHRGLLKWLRDLDTRKGLTELREVVDRIGSAAGTSRLRRLLDAVEALLVALLDGSVEGTAAVKMLFGRLDRVLKRLIDQGEASAMEVFPLDLYKNLLYYIARSNSDDPVVQAVRRTADLANSFPELSGEQLRSAPIGGVGRELFDTVAEALGEDLARIKDQLDLYMRGDRQDRARVEELLGPVRRMADTLAMVGRGDLRARLMPHCDAIRDVLEKGDAPGDPLLSGLADDLLVIESALPGLSEGGGLLSGREAGESPAATEGLAMSDAEYRQHLRSAVEQSFVELARTKEALTDYVADIEAPGVLAPVPDYLHAVHGMLTVIEQARLAELVEGLRRYIQDLVEGERPAPGAAEIEALANLFSGIEYHLEYLLDPSPDHARALDVAAEALAMLQGSDGPEVTDAGKFPPEAQDAVADEAALEVDAAGEADAGAQPAAGDYEVSGDTGTVARGEPLSELDSEILEIFVEEAREELGVLREHYPRWREEPGRQDDLTRIRRSFHTLKGSGRLVGATEIGEFAWSIENLLNRVIDGTVQAGPEVFALLDDTLELLPELIEARSQGGMSHPETLTLQERAFAYAEGRTPEGEQPTTPSGDSDSTLVLEEIEEIDVSEPDLDEETLTLDSSLLSDDVVSESVDGDESMFKSLVLDLDEEAEASEMNATAAGSRLVGSESILTPVDQKAPLLSLEPTLYEIFSKEAETHLQVVLDFIERCRGLAAGCLFDEPLRRALHTLRGSAHMAEVEPIAALAGALEHWANLCAGLEQRTDQAGIDLLERGHFVLSALLGAINQPGSALPSWENLVEEVGRASARLEGQVDGEMDMESQLAEAGEYDEELAAIFVDEARELADGLEHTFEQWRSRPDDLLPVVQIQRSLHTLKGGARLVGLDAIGDLAHASESLFESVVEQRVESRPEILHLARQALDAVATEVEHLEQGEPLQHHPALIERLEAAARNQEVPRGDLLSESVEREDAPSSVPLDDGDFEATPSDSQQQSDSLERPDSTLLGDSQLLTDSELLGESDLVGSSALVAGDGDISSVVHSDSRIIQFPTQNRAGEEGEPRRPPPPEEAAPAKKSRERVRVSAALLDQLVNNAGEISIYRARLEQENKTLGHNLDELGQTIGRLREQLRQLEIETEAQILSRHEREHEGELPEGFDPLEMDQYSTIQQLSRALSETTEDLNNIGETLQDLNRDTDTLLQQQGRVANDLQDGLLRTRMVPVGSRAARLQRVVRQTAQSLGKQAELKITGAQGEMDRAILERMMGPLEHLLRNAVAHGIETPEARAAAEKPALGAISLVVDREGPDVVLVVSDDGRGLDREAIRRVAEERGLIEPGAEVDGADLDAFILEAGLSTAGEVSQVSGRGVGMDVVVSEIKQLGGSLEIDSEPGRGTSFTIRLPFTLAITESLLVGVGEDIFAVPHGSLDGIARIPRDELEACYRGEQEYFNYGGRDYQVRHLGSMLGLGMPHLSEGERWLPVLLIRSGEHRVAIHVDRLLGNQQIVIKSLGTQLSTIRWFSGATILADGSIALILDMGALVRMETSHHVAAHDEAAQEEAVPEGIKVMVVDDSITVRKVTSRLLERHNMEVLTARDGVDAVALLQEHHPDVMLLDIEMPRMDGFELARHMRGTKGLEDIPIIMITSRTGDKHRLLAAELGVRRYLGKPYQEADLLDNIYTVLAESTE